MPCCSGSTALMPLASTANCAWRAQCVERFDRGGAARWPARSAVSTRPRCVLRNMRGRASGRGGGIERPAQMLSGVAQPDIDAMMGEHFVVKRADERKLFAERRWRFAFSGREITRKLAGKPRPALRAAADHHRVGSGCRQRRVGIVEVVDVAVDHDRDRHALFDGAHRRPIGAAVIELAARAAMHRDERDAGRVRRAAPAPARCANRRPSQAAFSASPALRPLAPPPRSA